MKTSFNDKTGKPIYTGDIVQWSLGKYAMKGRGPSYHQVKVTKKGVKLYDVQREDSLGMLLRKSDEQFIVITDTRYRETD